MTMHAKRSRDVITDVRTGTHGDPSNGHNESFVGHGGAQPVRWYGPPLPNCVVGIAPALGVGAEYYRPLAEALVRAGGGRLAAVPVDLPGHGTSPVRAGWRHDWGYREVVAHLAAFRRFARPRSRRFVWLGHSLGGQCALMDAEHADAVVLIASGTPYHACWSGASGARVLALSQLVALIASALGYFPGRRLGFGGREARTLMRQWAHVARRGTYDFETFDCEATLARVRVPVHAVTIEGDPYAPRRAVEHALGKLVLASITRHDWPSALQGDLARGNLHNRWPRFPDWPAKLTVGALRAHGLLADGP